MHACVHAHAHAHAHAHVVVLVHQYLVDDLPPPPPPTGRALLLGVAKTWRAAAGFIGGLRCAEHLEHLEVVINLTRIQKIPGAAFTGIPLTCGPDVR